MLRFLIIVFYFFLFSEAAYAKDSKGLFEQLVILAERGHEINFDNEAKNYGFKNFSTYQVLLGIGFSVILVHLAFARLSVYINSKFSDKNKLIKIKTITEYLIIILIVYYIFF